MKDSVKSTNEQGVTSGDSHNSETQMPQPTDKVVLACTVIAVIVTSVQTCFLYESNMISAASSDAAKQSIDLARDTAEKQLRAYVLAVEGRVIGLASAGPLKVRVTISNFGQTPAEGLTVTMREEWRDDFPPASPKTGDMMIKEGVQAVLAPGEKVYIEHDVEPLRQRLKNRTATLHAHGTIEYRDIYGIPRRAMFHFAQGGKYDPNSPLMGVDRN